MKQLSPDSNLRHILRNLPYLLGTKVLLLVMISALAFAASSQFFEGCRLFTDDRDGVRNALTQGDNFDLKTSVPFATELKKAINSILRYSLRYQDISGFAAPDVLAAQLEQEKKNCASQIDATRSICEWQVQSGEITKENLDNGFIVRDNNGFRVDNKAIEAHFTAFYDELMEGERRSLDREYRELMNTMEGFRGVYYAVMDHTANRLVTNTGCTKKSELQRFFSETRNNLIVFNADEPIFPKDTMDEFVPLVQEAAENYTQEFDFYLSLNDGLEFNEATAQLAERCATLYRQVHTLLVRFYVLCAVAFVLSVLLLLVAGKREYKGSIKYCATDRLPNEIHLLFHIIIVLSMFVLFQNSVQIVLLTKADDLWFPTFPDYYAIRGNVCFVILVLFALAAVCTVKRQYKNKSLLSNTLFAFVLRRFGKKRTDSENS